MVDMFDNPIISQTIVEAFENMEVTIVDMQGRLISELKLESKLTTIDLSEEAGGVYFLIIGNGDKSQVIRVVKE
ncbi:MAG: hypothetical protein COA38_21570 [Fluviicola sp.]|nr:MAG: hypothetical protein COA38_21570 [Fluviicola sp.]